VREIAPGLVWFTGFRDSIGLEVSSYWLPEERVVIDPMVPEEGLDAFADAPPEHVLLTNRHHDRGAWDYAKRFGSTVHCVRQGLHELEGRGEVAAFEFGDELPGGIVAYEVDAISPDETALHIPARGALACADGVVHYGSLHFVPDRLMDDPEDTKAGLRAAYGRLAETLAFDNLLVAHGDPVVGGAREALRAFASPGADA
jgi:glyoxylase-like metal-dependent hydrolase (beta-lactamase superfamily II)